jgi:UDP-3-O-[3-hydroxymyristoyl] glucosamine N-acyltransferase
VVDERFFNNYGPFSLEEVLSISGARIYNRDENIDITAQIKGVGPLDLADSGELSFFSNPKYADAYKASKAGYCITAEKFANEAPKGMIVIVSENPTKAYAEIARMFFPEDPVIKSRIASSARIASSVSIGKNPVIGEGVVIAENVTLGDNCMIGHNVVIERGVVIGDDCKIGASATICYCIIKDRVSIYTGVRIGQDGFGFASDRSGHMKIPQLGRVIIGNDVEIGANTAIDRGAGPDTIIGDGCVIDNLVQIGHNVELGKNCVVVSQVGIAGSTKVGDFVVLGGQVGVAGHLSIESGVQVAAQSGVVSTIKAGMVVGGTPAVPIRDWHRQTIALKKLTNKVS